jgi:hypothetical protein
MKDCRPLGWRAGDVDGLSAITASKKDGHRRTVTGLPRADFCQQRDMPS